MSYAAELDDVRTELERLVERRRERGLTEGEADRYAALAQRERQLLDRRRLASGRAGG